MNNIKTKKHFKRVILIIINITVSINIILANPIMAKTIQDNQTKGKDMIPFYWMIFIVRSCIAVTLSYVSWRKYKGEQKKKRNKDKSVD